MPIYEYACRSCGAEVEKLQGMSDPPLTDCATCGEAALKRKMSAPSFRLAGTGWYETDFKKDGKRNLAGDQNGSTDASSKDDSASTKTESKPEQKSSGSSDKGSGEKTQSAGAD